MIAIALALGLFGLLGHAPKTVTTKVVRVGTWKISVTQDAFTGSTTCRASERGMRLQREVVIFSLGHGADTSAALYRVDGGPAEPWRQYDAAAIRSLVLVDWGGLENPSGGIVTVPVGALSGARRVDIRATTRTTVRTFDVSRLGQVMDAERRAGCSVPLGGMSPASPS